MPTNTVLSLPEHLRFPHALRLPPPQFHPGIAMHHVHDKQFRHPKRKKINNTTFLTNGMRNIQKETGHAMEDPS